MKPPGPKQCRPETAQNASDDTFSSDAVGPGVQAWTDRTHSSGRSCSKGYEEVDRPGLGLLDTDKPLEFRIRSVQFTGFFRLFPAAFFDSREDVSAYSRIRKHGVNPSAIVAGRGLCPPQWHSGLRAFF